MGETLQWLEIASHLRHPLQQTQRQTTSTEFVLWSVFLAEKKKAEANGFNVQNYYLAQIAQVIAQCNAKEGSKFYIDDFILKFNTDGKPRKNVEDMTEDEQEEYKKEVSERSKAAWMGLVMAEDENQKPVVKPLPPKVIEATKRAQEHGSSGT